MESTEKNDIRPRGITVIGWTCFTVGIFFIIALFSYILGSAQTYEEKEIFPGLKLGLINILGYIWTTIGILLFGFAYGTLKGKRQMPRISRLLVPGLTVPTIIMTNIVVARDPVYTSPLLNILSGSVAVVLGFLTDGYIQKARVKRFFSQDIHPKDQSS